MKRTTTVERAGSERGGAASPPEYRPPVALGPSAAHERERSLARATSALASPNVLASTVTTSAA